MSIYCVHSHKILGQVDERKKAKVLSELELRTILIWTLEVGDNNKRIKLPIDLF